MFANVCRIIKKPSVILGFFLFCLSMLILFKHACFVYVVQLFKQVKNVGLVLLVFGT